MRKLKLESLEVTSFETSPATVRRGTVIANAVPPQGTLYIPTYEADACGETNYKGCDDTSYEVCTENTNIYLSCGCSVDVTCKDTCILTG